MKMKKILLSLLIFFSLNSIIFSQVSCNPDDEFYQFVEKWEIEGLIEKQLPLRPFSVERVKAILEKVENSSDKKNAETASMLRKKYFEKKANISLDINNFLKFNEKTNEYFFVNYRLFGDINFNSIFGLSYNLGGLSRYGNANYPYHERENFTKTDGFLTGDIFHSPEVDSLFSAEYKNFYFSAGINHISFGPFLGDNITFSSDAKHTGNFAIGYKGKKFSYTNLMSVLTAESGWNKDRMIYTSHSPEKYLFIQSYDYNFTNNFSMSFYQTVILGARFETLYFIPMLYVITEGISGYNRDNIFYGITSSYRAFDQLVFNTNFYVDDVGFYDADGNIDFNGTVKMRCALQSGLTWTAPKISWLDKLSLNYTLVAPYMYTHVSEYGNEEENYTLLPTNYQIYMTANSKLGTNLEPNSDRIVLSSRIAPLKNLTVDLNASFVRHANINENITKEEALSYLNAEKGMYKTDGSIYNTPYVPGYDVNKASPWLTTRFLAQDTIEYTYNIGFDALYTFPRTKYGTFSLGIGYTFEYIKNYGVTRDLFPGSKTESTTSEVLTLEDVDKAIAVWKAGLRDVFSNYFRIKVKYTF